MKKLLFALLISFSALSFGSGCPQLYSGEPLEVPGTVELCNSFYVSLFDNTNKRVIIVAEHLKPSKVSVPRHDAFHSDTRVGKTPSPAQYAKSGYDQGHMAPAGDASNDQEEYESFAMTNMTPQKPTLNRIEWRMLEERTRTLLAKSTSDMYVVNVAVYEGPPFAMKGIPIPTGYWKIVTVDGSTKYYYADNVDHGKVVEKDPVDIKSLLPK